MRQTVLVDCRVLDVPDFTGLTAHVSGLLRALQEIQQGPDVIEVIGLSRTWQDPSVHVQSLGSGSWRDAVASLVQALRREKSAVLYHGPANIGLPGLLVPQVVTIHDLIPLFDRGRGILDTRHYFRLSRQYQWSLRHATSIIFNSAAVYRQALAHGYGVSGHVIHPATSLCAMPWVHPKKPYFIYSGGHDRRKNMTGLIMGFKEFCHYYPEGTWKLVITGAPNRFTRFVERLVHRIGLRHAVDFVGAVPRYEWQRLVAEATALVNPSSLEGWGYPPVEAIQMGTCAVTVPVPSIVELNLERYCVMLESGGANVIAEGLEKALLSQVRDEDCIRLLPTWEQVAARVLALYRSCF